MQIASSNIGEGWELLRVTSEHGLLQELGSAKAQGATRGGGLLWVQTVTFTS